jgi:predicted nucleic-acid-binding Zn-ribbon protein
MHGSSVLFYGRVKCGIKNMQFSFLGYGCQFQSKFMKVSHKNFVSFSVLNSALTLLQNAGGPVGGKFKLTD